MSGGLSNQLSNIMGVAIPAPIRKQLWIRAKRNSAQKSLESNKQSQIIDRDNQLARANKNCFVRLVSSVSVKDESIRKVLNDSLPNIDKSDEDSLAKNFVLFGGTSNYNKNQDTGQFSYNLRSGQGFLGAYGLLGDMEITNFGYRPMPGITDVKVTTIGKLGSVRSATVNIKVWNKAQLDIIDLLYFKLGYTMFLEWGHVLYFDNGEFDPDNPNSSFEPRLQRGDINMIDPFSIASSSTAKGAAIPTKEDLAKKIYTNIEDTSGNYDAMIGMVTKFNFSLNQEGGFDCTLEMQALGTLADAMKINQAQTLPAILANEVEKFVDIANAELLEQARKEIEAEQLELQAAKQKEKDDAASKYPKGQTPEEYLKSAGYTDAQIKAAEAVSFIRGDREDFVLSADVVPAGKQPDGNIKFYSKKFGVGFATQNPDVVSTPDFQAYIDQVGLNKSNYTLQSQIKSITLRRDIVGSSIKFFREEGNQPFDRKDFGIGGNTLTDDKLFPITPRDGYDRVGTFLTKTGNLPGLIEIENTFDLVDDIIKLSNDEQTRLAITCIEKAFSQDTEIVTYQQYLNTKDDGIQDLTVLQDDLVYEGRVSSFGIYQYVQGDGPKCKVRYSNKGDTNITINRSNKSTYYFQFRGTVKAFIHKQKTDQDPFVDGAPLPSTQGQLITIPYILTLFDTGYIENMDDDTQTIIFESRLQKLREAAVNEVKALDTPPNPADRVDELTVDEVQQEEAKKFRSGLEIFLRSIQLRSLNKNIDAAKASNPTRYSLLENAKDGKSWITKLFANGLFEDLITKIVSGNTINKNELEKIAQIKDGMSGKELLNAQSARGFNHHLLKLRLDGKSSITVNDFPIVDYEAMFSSYIFPYKINQGIVKGVDFNYPVYIPFGLLLMAINHASTIYDSPQGETVDVKSQRPLVYLDFNPETTYCLSEPLHFTTNVFQCLIPFNGTDKAYEDIFDKEVLAFAKKQSEGLNLFLPQTQDNISGLINQKHPFKLTDTPYKAKALNILLNIDYLLNVCSNFAAKDDSQSVYFKQFLEQILTDINKSLGDINTFRLAYDDYSNCYYISDDQFMPLDKSDQYVQSYPIGSTLPLYGVQSIARSLELKTEISNKLSNMIAISANSDINTDISKDSSPISIYSRGLQDRYIKQKTSIGSGKLNTGKDASQDKEGDAAALRQFNHIMIQNYSSKDTTEDNVPVATNYYIERMNKRKGEKKPTYASAIIPISVNFSTDGIAGLAMGHAFTLPDELLPYSYKRAPSGSIVGFVIMGLDHSISQNSWTTNIRANMTYLKNSDEFKVDAGQFNTSLFAGSYQNVNVVSNAAEGGSNVVRASASFKKIVINAGYPEGSPAYTLATTIGAKEGWSPTANGGVGSRSFRNNNPGNLDYSDSLKSIDPKVTLENNPYGGKNRFAAFSTAELGVKALIENKLKKWAAGSMPVTAGNQNLIAVSEKWKKGTKPTLAQVMYTYAPPNENDTENYLNTIIKSIQKSGVNRYTLLADVLT